MNPTVDLFNIEFVAIQRAFIINSNHEGLYFVLYGFTATSFTSGISWLDFLQESEESHALLGSEIDFGIWMESKGKRCLTWSFVINVFSVFLIAKVQWWTLEGYILSFNEWE